MARLRLATMRTSYAKVKYIDNES